MLSSAAPWFNTFSRGPTGPLRTVRKVLYLRTGPTRPTSLIKLLLSLSSARLGNCTTHILSLFSLFLHFSVHFLSGSTHIARLRNTSYRALCTTAPGLNIQIQIGLALTHPLRSGSDVFYLLENRDITSKYTAVCGEFIHFP